jgi:AraC family transcriptional regulator, arabinose operon regulatory protein
MMYPEVTPAATSAPILAGLQIKKGADSMWQTRAWRPRGTLDWLLVYTLDGHATVLCDNKEYVQKSGSAFLISPHTPQDYGLKHMTDHWSNIWVHFRPRSDWIPHLKWPEVAPGTALMSYPNDPRSSIESKLYELVRHFQGPSALARDLAMNALENILLVTSEINPARVNGVQDPRIRRATQLICDNLTKPLVIREVAKEVGLSRTRFSVLFHETMGCPPQEYIEIKRLERVADLLVHSTLHIASIADQTGFSCPFYLSRRFSRRYKQTPTDYRAKANA